MLARNRTELDAAAASIRASGGTVIAIPTDIADPFQVIAAIDEAEAALGSISILVNNAAINPATDLVRGSFEAWEAVIQVNLYGAVHCSRRMMPPTSLAPSFRSTVVSPPPSDIRTGVGSFEGGDTCLLVDRPATALPRFGPWAEDGRSMSYSALVSGRLRAGLKPALERWRWPGRWHRNRPGRGTWSHPGIQAGPIHERCYHCRQ